MTSSDRFKRFVDLLARQAARESAAAQSMAMGTATSSALATRHWALGTSTATS
jgi:hypothetical protein